MLEFNRRNFCRLGALVPLSAVFAPFSAFCAPFHSSQSAVSHPLRRRILVAYATRCGSTREISQVIFHDLAARGCTGDIAEAAQVSSVSGYECVVLGSAVHYYHCLPEAVDFVRRNQTQLSRIRTACFAVHLLNTGTDDASTKARLSYLDDVRELIKPSSEAFFSGKLDTSQLGFFDRMGCKIMGMHDEDRRDWNAVHSFANNVFSDKAGSGQ